MSPERPAAQSCRRCAYHLIVVSRIGNCCSLAFYFPRDMPHLFLVLLASIAHPSRAGLPTVLRMADAVAWLHCPLNCASISSKPRPCMYALDIF